MALIFNNALENSVTTATTIYTVPALTTSVVIGFRVTNMHASNTAAVTVLVTSSAVDYHISENLPILPTAAVELTANGKFVLLAGELIEVTSTEIVDIVFSCMEQS